MKNTIEVVKPTTGEILNLFHQIKHSGRIFSTEFRKRSDGSTRVMLCKYRVTKHLKGGSLPYNAASKGLLPVYDLNKEGYRTVNLNDIHWVKLNGKMFILK